MTPRPVDGPSERVPLFLDDTTLYVAVDRDPGRGDRPDLWPSVGEYPCYDPFLYGAMERDGVRNREFERALARLVAGRHVLDIGTGQSLQWALTAARLGARRVVAVEAIPEAYDRARRLLATRPEAAVVELVNGYSTDLVLDDRAEVCVAEIIGSIASSEGMLAVVADARRRLLTDDAVVVPHLCTTVVAAMGLRSLFPAGLALSADAVGYLGQVFEMYGGPFDIRLAIANVASSALVSTAATVETLAFNGTTPPSERSEVQLRMVRDGEVDGVLCWITLTAHDGGDPIDTLQQRTSWVPVYLPLFDEPVRVRADDRLDVGFERLVGDDGVHPDYRVSARLHTGDGAVTGGFRSPHHGGAWRTAAVYRELFQPQVVP